MMWKNIAGDYYRAYSWRGIKEMWKTNTGALVAMIYPVIVMLLQMRSAEKSSFLIVYLPMLYILFSVYMHPVRLCKMMYLCPMEADRRRRYIRCAYCFRLVLHMSVAVIGTGILMLSCDCDAAAAAGILLNDLVLSILIPTGTTSGECYGIIRRETVCMVFMIVASMLCNLISVLAIQDKEPHKMLDIIIFACIVFIQLPLSVKYWKYVQDELEAAVYYENP